MLRASCVCAWLQRHHAIDATIRSGQAKRTVLEGDSSCTVEHNSRLLQCSLTRDTRKATSLRVTELWERQSHSWPLPRGHAYSRVFRPHTFSRPSGTLAVPFGGPWAGDAEEADGALGCVLVSVASGACTTVLLPPQSAGYWDTHLLGWSPGLAACLFVAHLVDSDALSAYSLDGALISRLAVPTFGGAPARLMDWDLAGCAAALASYAIGGSARVWRWEFRSGSLQDFGVRSVHLAGDATHGCVFSPYSGMLLRPVGDGLDVVEICSRATLQHIPGIVDPGVIHWNHVGVTVLAHTTETTSGAAQLFRSSGSPLGAARCLTPSPKKFWSELAATSEHQRHLLLVAGAVIEDELSGEFELWIVDVVSCSVVARHSLDCQPSWFDFGLDDSVIVIADEDGQRLWVLDFRS